MKKWLSWNCHDCGVQEGEIHKLGCDMERCPICGWQLITCDHARKRGWLKDKLSREPTLKELEESSVEDHYKLVKEGKVDRIPYILIPNKCELCGEQWCPMFGVPDEEWDKYVIPPLKEKVLCWECYLELVKMFPDGWRNVNE